MDERVLPLVVQLYDMYIVAYYSRALEEGYPHIK